MHSQFTWEMLLVLAVLKIAATSISFSSGTPGGMFAPTLFIGATLGAALGVFEKKFFPGLNGSIGSYALVGMGVLFAAFLRAPLTSVFMVLEVSQNYSIVLPVILANTIAYTLSRSLQPVPIFELLTKQSGLVLPSMEEIREEDELRLEDALEPVTVPVLQGSSHVADAIEKMAQNSIALVHCADGRWYAMRRDEMEDSEREIVVEELTRGERTPVLYPDLPSAKALPHLERWDLLPIISRAGGTLEGVVTLSGLMRRDPAALTDTE